MGGSIGDLPILTIQDPLDVQDASVHDCQPPLLPMSLKLSDIGSLSMWPTVMSASLAVPPWEDGLTISGVGPDVVAFPELEVEPLVDSGTDLEDELSTPDGSPSTDAIEPGEVVLPVVRPAPRGVIDLELEKALFQVSILPMMMTPIVDPVMESSVTPAVYPEPPLPVLSVDDQVPVLESVDERVLVSSPLREVAFPSYLASPAGLVYGPITSLISPCLRTDDVSRHHPVWQRWTSTCRGIVNCCWGSQMPLTPRPMVEEMFLGSAVGSPAGEPVAAPSHSMPDLSREGPFDVHQYASESGASPQVLDSLPDCQYHMTSYDEDTNCSDFSPGGVCWCA